jgi:O-antigen/teichoic acid export membrane protein
MVIGFGTSVLVARALGAEGRGEYALILVVIQLLAPIGGILHGGNSILVGESFERLDYLVVQTIVWCTLLAVVVCGGMLLLPNRVLETIFGRTDLATIGVVTFTLWGMTSEAGLRDLWMGRQRFFFVNWTELGTAVFHLTGAFTLFLWSKTLGVIFILSVVSAKNAIKVFSYLSEWEHAQNSSHFIKRYRKLISGSLKIGTRQVIFGISTMLILKVDIWLLGYLSQKSTVGIYHIAVGVCTVFLALTQVLNSLIKAKSVSETGGADRAVLVSKLVLVAGIIGSALMVTFGEVFFRYIYGSAFAPAYNPATILIIALIGWGYSSPLAGYIVGKEKYPWFVVISAIVALIFNVGLNIWLIPIWKASGAAFASLVAYIFMMSVFTYEFWRNTDTYFAQFFLFSRDEIKLIASVANKILGQVNESCKLHR